MALLFPTWVIGHPNAICSLVLLLPLVADGMLQLCTRYESGNFRRLVTGILFGYALANLLLQTVHQVAAQENQLSAGALRRAWLGAVSEVVLWPHILPFQTFSCLDNGGKTC
jgi:hypothetical protein